MRPLAFAAGLAFATQAFTWGPATHLHLVERATGSNRPLVHFGSMLPDMNNMIFNKAEVFDAVRHLTHNECDRVAPSCLALGMISHNEAWGADWYSHQYWLPETPESAGLYSTRKIRHLEEALGVNPGQAEFLFEFAVDYLLRVEEGPAMGNKLLASAAVFGPSQQQLIVDAFTRPLAERVPGLSNEQAERELRAAANLYRLATKAYGAAFIHDEEAVFNALTSLTALYLCFDGATAEHHLAYAIELCHDDYRAELDRIAELLRADMASQAPESMAACSWGCSAPANASVKATFDPALGMMLAAGTLRIARRRCRPRRVDEHTG